MTEFKQWLADGNVLAASLWLAKQFDPNVNVNRCLSDIATMAETVLRGVDPQASEAQRLQQFHHGFYQDCLFALDRHSRLNAQANLMHCVVTRRCGVPVALAILYRHFAQQCGFDVEGIHFPGHFLLRHQWSEDDIQYIDPLTGNTLSWSELETLYQSMLGDDVDELDDDILCVASAQQMIERLLHNLKGAYLDADQHEKALHAVELLLTLSPDDPYERRDRGYLLHRLTNARVAMADYRYFIRECPQDPSAYLLKLQLRHWDALPTPVLH
ncbi:tetratricopeptide repeat protein [Aestuariibacter halophilus]|uniref:Tetratricopeptide repeat protein n=1 Tax=Fluctibacter halophilus TaxID=226011 RepID=A0ABS8G663_9ALTE|nr:tetratricopeptide repeat protein [Aestuariibacter halophilus]MCC2616015.1 tetratricopeptide repeat protein [Aestuariibacter halophilus]